MRARSFHGTVAMFAGLVAAAACSSSSAGPSTVAGDDGGTAAGDDAAGGGGIADAPASEAGRSDAGSACSPSYGQFGPHVYPPACYQFYAPTDPLNTPIPANPMLDPNSSTLVSQALAAWGSPGQGNFYALGQDLGTNDYAHPVYFSQPGDPLYTIHVTTGGGTSNLEGLQVPIPAVAKPAGGTDHHLCIIDQAAGKEYDMWQAADPSGTGGPLTCSWGEMTDYSATSSAFFVGSATAGGFHLPAGLVRSEEFVAGEIRHALFAVVPCCVGVSPWVSTRGGNCDYTCTSGQGLAMGARIVLGMTDAEITALGKNSAATAVLMALAHYGAIVGDTAQGYKGGIFWPMATTTLDYEVYGDPDPVTALGQKEGWGANLDFATGVDWTKLEVVDDCVSAQTCL